MEANPILPGTHVSYRHGGGTGSGTVASISGAPLVIDTGGLTPSGARKRPIYVTPHAVLVTDGGELVAVPLGRIARAKL